MLAGTGSGCGKTTASLVLMAALKARGLDVAPCKAGPDYIDPGLHAAVCGRPSRNLDSFLMPPEAVRRACGHPADVTLIEGVMGYYDGLDARTFRASSLEIARLTETPVLLLCDASGGAASLAAAVRGFSGMTEDSRIAGVLVNRCSGEAHYGRVREAVEYHAGLPCLGWLPKDLSLRLSSRHLGLVPAEETPDLRERAAAAAEAAEKTLDIPGILEIAARAKPLPSAEAETARAFSGMRVGVARDEAFSFYYQDNLDYLEALGMTLVPFSPLRDAALPPGLDCLYLGGGFPEVFKEALSGNAGMRESVRAALEHGMPCYAECGGLLYLSRELDGAPMAGFLPVRARMTGRLQRFGYVLVRDGTGLSFPAHEFHYAAAGPEGTAFEVRKASDPARAWRCGWERGRTLGAFPHVYFAGRPELVRRLFHL